MAAGGLAPLRVLESRPLAVCAQNQPQTTPTTNEKHDNGFLGPASWLFMRQRSLGNHPWLFIGGRPHTSGGTPPQASDQSDQVT